MGLEVVATSSLVYGVVVKTPVERSWPLVLKRLQEWEKKGVESGSTSSTIAASGSKDDEEGLSDDSQKPVTKVAKMTKQYVFHGDDHNDMDEIGEINYLQDHDDDISKAAKEAFDKVLGLGHGLTMKVYYGHDEDTSRVELLLQVEDCHVSGPVDSRKAVSMLKVDPTLRGGDKDKIDALILKALAIFGLDVSITEEGKEQPGWIMATTCALYR